MTFEVMTIATGALKSGNTRSARVMALQQQQMIATVWRQSRTPQDNTAKKQATTERFVLQTCMISSKGSQCMCPGFYRPLIAETGWTHQKGADQGCSGQKSCSAAFVFSCRTVAGGS